MGVPVINKNGILTLKAECEPPVAVDSDGPMPAQFACEGVELPTWGIYVFGLPGTIQSRELHLQSRNVSGLDTSS